MKSSSPMEADEVSGAGATVRRIREHDVVHHAIEIAGKQPAHREASCGAVVGQRPDVNLVIAQALC